MVLYDFKAWGDVGLIFLAGSRIREKSRTLRIVSGLGFSGDWTIDFKLSTHEYNPTITSDANINIGNVGDRPHTWPSCNNAHSPRECKNVYYNSRFFFIVRIAFVSGKWAVSFMKLWYFSFHLEIRFKLVEIIFYRKASKSEAISLRERLDPFFHRSKFERTKYKDKNISRGFSEISMDGFREATFRPSRKSKEIKRKEKRSKRKRREKERKIK